MALRRSRFHVSGSAAEAAAGHSPKNRCASGLQRKGGASPIAALPFNLEILTHPGRGIPARPLSAHGAFTSRKETQHG